LAEQLMGSEVFMRTIVTSLTAAMLLVHALVGCCRHREQDCASCHRIALSGRSLATHCCHDDHAACSEEGDRPIAPCKCKLECRALCISLPPEKTLLDAGELAPCGDVVTAAGRAATICSSAADGYSGAEQAAQAPEPPLRLHLLHQIILV
jgi:hypothetical protein